MKKNMGNFDRLIRVVVAAILAFFAGSVEVKGHWVILFYLIAGIFLLTSFFSFCPLYVLFGWNTTKGPSR